MSAFVERPGQSGRESSRFVRRLIAALFCGLATVASHAGEPKLLKVPSGEDWKIEIVPGPAGAGAGMPAGINRASYSEVYNSIPFRRSEYLANPSYRHDATIELMLGQIRPTTITNVMVTQATCCWPQVATFSPWGAYAFDDRKSRFRP